MFGVSVICILWLLVACFSTHFGCCAAALGLIQPKYPGAWHPVDWSNLYRLVSPSQGRGTFDPVEYDSSFTRASKAAAVVPVVVHVSCGAAKHLCQVRACSVSGSNQRIENAFCIGEVIIMMPAIVAAATLARPLTLVVCSRPASESQALFVLPKNAEGQAAADDNFDCFRMSVMADAVWVKSECDEKGQNCYVTARVDLAILERNLELLQLVLYELYVHVEMNAEVETVTAVSQPAYFTASHNVSVLVWGNHGGTLKTSVEMLLLAGVVPERLFCFQLDDHYKDVLAGVPCTRPSFTAEMAHFLKSQINHPWGFGYSSIRNNSVEEFTDKWSTHFDEFDVRSPPHAIVAYNQSYLSLSDLFSGHLD